MKINRLWLIYAVAIAIVGLLVFVLWDRVSPSSEPEEPVSQVKREPTPEIPVVAPPGTRASDDCESCPDTQVVQEHKRTPVRDASTDCYEFLVTEANAGNPFPDTSQLEDCSGLTPLHVAETPQQIQTLLEAGANLNSRDLDGRTPLYLQVQRAMAMPSKDGQSIVNMLLNSGANPWLKAYSGRSVLDIARLSDTSAMRAFRMEGQLRKRLEARGITMEDAIARNPELGTQLDRIMEEPRIASEILVSLATAMRQTQPST